MGYLIRKGDRRKALSVKSIIADHRNSGRKFQFTVQTGYLRCFHISTESPLANKTESGRQIQRTQHQTFGKGILMNGGQRCRETDWAAEFQLVKGSLPDNADSIVQRKLRAFGKSNVVESIGRNGFKLLRNHDISRHVMPHIHESTFPQIFQIIRQTESSIHLSGFLKSTVSDIAHRIRQLEFTGIFRMGQGPVANVFQRIRKNDLQVHLLYITDCVLIQTLYPVRYHQLVSQLSAAEGRYSDADDAFRQNKSPQRTLVVQGIVRKHIILTDTRLVDRVCLHMYHLDLTQVQCCQLDHFFPDILKILICQLTGYLQVLQILHIGSPFLQTGLKCTGCFHINIHIGSQFKVMRRLVVFPLSNSFIFQTQLIIAGFSCFVDFNRKGMKFPRKIDHIGTFGQMVGFLVNRDSNDRLSGSNSLGNGNSPIGIS